MSGGDGSSSGAGARCSTAAKYRLDWTCHRAKLTAHLFCTCFDAAISVSASFTDEWQHFSRVVSVCGVQESLCTGTELRHRGMCTIRYCTLGLLL